MSAGRCVGGNAAQLMYGSLFSGIEAATVAWASLGWRPAFFAEIAPFCCALLAHHYPDVSNLSDVNEFEEWSHAAVDLIVGGSPCQDFSVAGRRAGLRGARGQLTLVYLEVLRHIMPRWIVWENVPGVLSSNGGRDFGAFLGELGKLGYGWAYRVLDAQYVRVESHARAVPQRRRRVILVGHGAAAGKTPGVVNGVLPPRGGVRRLTPRECERLQGFPDDYTRIPYRNFARHPRSRHFRKHRDQYAPNVDGSWTRFAPDGPRYKALGNSMAVNVMRWVGERIQMVEEIIRRGS